MSLVLPYWGSGGQERIIFTAADLGIPSTKIKIWCDGNDPSVSTRDGNSHILTYTEKGDNSRGFVGVPAGGNGIAFGSGQLGALNYFDHTASSIFDWDETPDIILSQPNIVYVLAKSNLDLVAVLFYYFDSAVDTARNFMFWQTSDTLFPTGGSFTRTFAQVKTWTLYKIQFNGASSHVKINNVANADATAATFNAGAAGMNGVSLFNRATTQQASMNGFTAQFLVTESLTATEEDNLDNFFQNNYGSFYGT